MSCTRLHLGGGSLFSSRRPSAQTAADSHAARSVGHAEPVRAGRREKRVHLHCGGNGGGSGCGPGSGGGHRCRRRGGGCRCDRPDSEPPCSPPPLSHLPMFPLLLVCVDPLDCFQVKRLTHARTHTLGGVWAAREQLRALRACPQTLSLHAEVLPPLRVRTHTTGAPAARCHRRPPAPRLCATLRSNDTQACWRTRRRGLCWRTRA